MSKKLLFAVIAVILLFAMVAPMASAQSATGQAWVTSITYYTPSDTGGTLLISFFAEGSATEITIPGITLQPHTAGSLYVGGVSTLPTSFKGSAVLSSDVYVVATSVTNATSPETNNYARVLYTGFSEADAASQVYIATMLKNQFNTTSTLAIQNTESFAVKANVKVYQVGTTTPFVEKDYVIPPQSDVILGGPSNAGALNLPSGFNGSAVVTGAKDGEPGTPGKLVASVQETDDSGRGARAFEGVSTSANTIYMASMNCKSGPDPLTSTYAIQNASLTEDASVTIDFYNRDGVKIASMPAVGLTPGAKTSQNPCSNGVAAGTIGSAVISSTGGKIIAMGKVASPGGISTAFLGQPGGAAKIAAPYIRWAKDTTSEWRTFVAIMNVGGSPATNVQAKYYDGNATLKATHTIADAAHPLGPSIKRNTDPATAGALQPDGTFGLATAGVPYGGSIEITSDQPIVVVVRASKSVNLGTTTTFGEDYNGVAIP
jgi:hypothetical protein